MDRTRQLEGFHGHLLDNGYSETASKNYRFRVSTFLKRRPEALGAGEILLTSMDGDGTKAGYDLALTRAVAEAVGIPVIASGGAGTMEHFLEAFTQGKADAALAASLFHCKELEIRMVKSYLRDRGISVRL